MDDFERLSNVAGMPLCGARSRIVVGPDGISPPGYECILPAVHMDSDTQSDDALGGLLGTSMHEDQYGNLWNYEAD